MSSQLDQAIDPKHYVRMIWRRKGLVILCGVIAFCAALIGLQFVPKEYESRVTLMIADRRPLTQELELVIGGMPQTSKQYGSDEKQLAEMIGRVRSRPFLERVIRMLRMHEDPAIRARAAEQQKKRTELTVDDLAVRILTTNIQSRIRFGSAGSGIFQVTVGDYSPENARNLARWISELFVEDTIQRSLDHLRATHEFGTEQLRIYEDRHRRAEAALEHHKRAELEENLIAGLVRRENVMLAEALRQRVRDEATAAQTRMKQFSDTVHRLRPGTSSGSIIAALETRFRARELATVLNDELTDRLASGATEMGTWQPRGTYSAVGRLLEQLEDEIAQRYPDASAEAQDAMVQVVFCEIDRAALIDAAAFLEEAIRAFRHQIQSQPLDDTQMARLEGDVRTSRELLQSFKAQLVASDVRQALETTDLGVRIEILDPAELPLSPSRPNRIKVLMASLFLGPLLGLGLAFAGETMDPTLRSLEDFARMGSEPILGTAPLLSRIAPRRPGRLRRHWVPVSMAFVVVLTGAFFLARPALVDQALAGQPVKMIDPETSEAP